MGCLGYEKNLNNLLGFLGYGNNLNNLLGFLGYEKLASRSPHLGSVKITLNSPLSLLCYKNNPNSTSIETIRNSLLE